MAEKRLRTDLLKIHRDPPPGVSASLVDSNLFLWDAIICGPEATLFEGGVFKLRLEFTPDYPNKAPTVWFFTKMFHPNVYSHGRICLDILEEPEKWMSEYDVAAVLQGIQAMLGDPNPESPANSYANEVYQNQPGIYEQRVKEIVELSLISDLDEEGNQNLAESLEQQELENRMNEMAIQIALDGNVWEFDEI